MTSLRILLILLFSLAGCRTLPQGALQTTPSGDPTTMEKEQILSTRDQRFIDFDALMVQIMKTQVVYLGEKHDNIHHHQAQLKILKAMIQAGKRPSLGFEFFSREQTGWLMNYTQGEPSVMVQNHGKSASQRLKTNLGWDEREDWDFYFPLIQLAKEHHLPVFGADLASGTRLRMVRSGLEKMLSLEKNQIPASQGDNLDYQALIEEQLVQSHCGMATGDFLKRQYVTWTRRNETMALSIREMLADFPDQPVVLIVGYAHVAHDMGVLERLQASMPEVRQLNIGFRERTHEFRIPEDYLQPVTFGKTTFPPDHPFIWFTPPALPDGDPDPCAKFHQKKQADKNMTGK